MDKIQSKKTDQDEYAAGYFAGLDDINSRIDGWHIKHREDTRTTFIVIVIAVIAAFIGGFIIRDLL